MTDIYIDKYLEIHWRTFHPARGWEWGKEGFPELKLQLFKQVCKAGPVHIFITGLRYIIKISEMYVPDTRHRWFTFPNQSGVCNLLKMILTVVYITKASYLIALNNDVRKDRPFFSIALGVSIRRTWLWRNSSVLFHLSPKGKTINFHQS